MTTLLSDPTVRLWLVQKASNEQILAAFRETGSVWETAKQLDMAGQAVQERLVALGYQLRGRAWSDGELAELRRLVEELVPLGEIARRLGRPYAGTAIKASALGIKSAPKRARRVPRGAGYDKATMKAHVVSLWRYEGTLTQYVRSRSLQADPFVRAFQQHFPEAWADYSRLKNVPVNTCPYCEAPFYPSSVRQRFCTSKCSGDARRDEDYFGGNRRNTVGLRAGVCQLCGGERTKGLSSHHVLGKDNDPTNEVLIALCRGCHSLVGELSSRKFVEDPAAWESLISLVWLRRRGKVINPGDELHVFVEMELQETDTEESLAQAA